MVSTLKVMKKVALIHVHQFNPEFNLYQTKRLIAFERLLEPIEVRLKLFMIPDLFNRTLFADLARDLFSSAFKKFKICLLIFSH